MAADAKPFRPTMAALVAVVVAAGCLERHDDFDPGPESGCASCHGAARPDQDRIRQSAPPHDLNGNTDPRYPGVGAHEIHLSGSSTHGPIPCSECHVVPEATDSPGHADSPLPAEVTFGTLAQQDADEASYDYGTRTCSSTYCHGAAAPRWTAPRSSDEACGSCHGLPPAPPHPQSTQCSRCHTAVVDDNLGIRSPALHVNGTVETDTPTCTTCHGSGADPAPPVDLLGNSSREAIGVGAHQVHLSGGQFSRPLACSECHVVPETINAPGHLDDSPHAEVVLAPLANGEQPHWNRATSSCVGSFCHGPSAPEEAVSPLWNQVGASLDCTACHGMPPPLPHPQSTRCSACHSDVVAADDRTMLNRDLHVDGDVQLRVTDGCSDCHGTDASPAPPRDLSGEMTPNASGVGAHTRHLAPSFSRPVACNECHVVPETLFSEGHLDSTAPAEVTFSGVGAKFEADPSYDGKSCSNTFCHAPSLSPERLPGGAVPAPQWTQTDGTPVACNGCHGLPPPPPHPETTEDCSTCHFSVVGADLRIINPDLHVNGRLEF